MSGRRGPTAAAMKVVAPPTMSDVRSSPHSIPGDDWLEQHPERRGGSTEPTAKASPRQRRRYWSTISRQDRGGDYGSQKDHQSIDTRLLLRHKQGRHGSHQ